MLSTFICNPERVAHTVRHRNPISENSCQINSSVLSLQPGIVSSDLAVHDRIPRNSFRPEDMLFKDRGSAEADQFRELLLCQIEQTFARPGRQSGLPSAPDEDRKSVV